MSQAAVVDQTALLGVVLVVPHIRLARRLVLLRVVRNRVPRQVLLDLELLSGALGYLADKIIGSDQVQRVVDPQPRVLHLWLRRCPHPLLLHALLQPYFLALAQLPHLSVTTRPQA